MHFCGADAVCDRDNANGASTVNDSATLEYMKNTFTAHYNGNRQPIGLYTHPIHLSTTYPGVKAPNSTITMINNFLDWAQQQQNGELLFIFLFCSS